MTLNKGIEHHKEKRKPYRGAKAVDAMCRNHGSCLWCEENRKHATTVAEIASEQRIKEYNNTEMGDESV